MKTVQEIMDDEFSDSIFQSLEPFEIEYIKDAMRIIAELFFDAGHNYVTHKYSVQHPNKEQFIKELFDTNKQELK